MPLYEYHCPVCDVKFEKIRSWSQADDPITCPNGHEGAKRLRGTFMAQRGGEEYGVPAAIPGTRPPAPRAKRVDPFG